MNEVDWIILAVLAISTIVGLFRGIVRELMAIVGWVLAIVLALRFSPWAGELIPLSSVDPSIRTIFGAILIAVVVLFACGILGRIAGAALSAASVCARGGDCLCLRLFTRHDQFYALGLLAQFRSDCPGRARH